MNDGWRLGAFSEERLEKSQALLSLMQEVLGHKPTIYNILFDDKTVIVIGGDLTDQAAWTMAIKKIFGEVAEVRFEVKESPEKSIGMALWGKPPRRSVGDDRDQSIGEIPLLNVESLECGCEALQIVGDLGWQLQRNPDCKLPIHKPTFLDV